MTITIYITCMSNLLDLNIKVKELILQNDHQEANNLINQISNTEMRILLEFDLLIGQGRIYQLKNQVLQIMRNIRYYDKKFIHKILYYRALIHLFENEMPVKRNRDPRFSITFWDLAGGSFHLVRRILSTP